MKDKTLIFKSKITYHPKHLNGGFAEQINVYASEGSISLTRRVNITPPKVAYHVLEEDIKGISRDQREHIVPRRGHTTENYNIKKRKEKTKWTL